MNRTEITFTLLVSSTRLARNAISRLIPPLIPVLAVALAYPLWQLGLLVTLFSLGSGLGQAPFGYLSDTYDRRYLLPTGLSIAGASYLLFAVAPQIEAVFPLVPFLPFEVTFLVMCVSMLVCGFGTSVVHPTTYPMITENVRAENKGKVLGIFGSSAKIGDAVTPIFVGLLVLALVWEEIVALLGVFGIAYSALLFVLLGNYETVPVGAQDEDEREDDGSDAGTRDVSGGEDDDETVWESDNREYVYPMFVIYLFFITRGFAGKGIKTFVPAFIVGVYGYTVDFGGIQFAAESVANFYFSALLIVGAATQIALGWVVDSYDSRTVLIVCMIGATGGILGLAYLPLSPVPLLFVLFVVGAGIWGLNPARDMLISRITPPEREGRTFGYLWTASHLTSAFIPALVGYMADVFGLRQSFGVLAVGSFLAVVSIGLLYSDRVYVETGSDRVSGHAVE